MKKILIVVDMQKDFVDGSLGTPEAQAMVPAAAKKIREFDGDAIYVTYDTHGENYPETLEGKNLPVPHCIRETDGWRLTPAVTEALKGKVFRVVEKGSFGSLDLPKELGARFPGEALDIELIGLCTEICVLSNAILLRATFPNDLIRVDPACCAGVTPAAHEAALTVLNSCQIATK